MFMKRWVAVAMLAVTGGVAAGHAHAKPVSVVTSFSILGDLVSQVGGDDVTVHALVGADQDAHVFQPRPSDAAQVSRAQLVIVNGLGFEGWMTRLIESADYRGPVRVASEGMPHPLKGSGHDHDHDDHGHDHDHGPKVEEGAKDKAASDKRLDDVSSTDPHAWQNPLNVVSYVRNIAQALAEVDPANAENYDRRAEAYVSGLQELDQWIDQQMQAVPAGKRTVITSHEAMRYFGERYGVRFLAPQGVSTASEPGAREVARLVRQVRDENVTALFLESITNAALLQQIAAEAKVTVGGRLYSDALSGPKGPAPDYLSMMRHNVTNLKAAMQGVE